MNYYKYILKCTSNIFIFFFICGLFYSKFPDAHALSSSPLNKRIQDLLQNPSLRNVSYGINVVSIHKNTSLFSYRSNDLFSVASNMKLLTTAAALYYLGSDFEYKTNIIANGKITGSGVLDGDIIIEGSGDPNLSGRFYDGNIFAVPESWVNAIRERGIHNITGDIIADDRVFDRIYTNLNWPENQMSEWYCAPSCGLSFNDNCVDITVVPEKKPGDVVTLLIDPQTSYFTIFNNCFYTSSKKDHAYSIYRKPGTNQIFVKGKFWVNAFPEKQWVTVHNPALYMATVFKETLEKGGITVNGNARLIDEADSINSDAEIITQTISTLEQTVLVTNKKSQNFYAEQILKTLGKQIKGQGSLKAGIEVLHDFMATLGFHPEDYNIVDGSGLSKSNKLSPKIITSILTYMNKHPCGKVLYNSLPVSGIDGGLKRRITSPRYKNVIHAKTGYIANASALSGYIDTSNGDMLAFSILMNDFKNLDIIHKIQDDICRTLVDYYN